MCAKLIEVKDEPAISEVLNQKAESAVLKKEYATKSAIIDTKNNKLIEVL